MNAMLSLALILTVLLDFVALGSSRLRVLIRTVGIQGALLGLMPLLQEATPGLRVLGLCLLTATVKGVVIPKLLFKAIRDAHIRREVEPLLGFIPSLMLGAAGTGLAMIFADSLPLVNGQQGTLVVSVSFATVLSGFILLTTRHKAITQVVGYLVLENGVFIFGLLLIDAMPLLVELAVLLDVLVGVFVMGIIINHIRLTFSSLDTAHLTTLKE
ncbi:MAG: hydrogenase [Candidatus Hydrogenedentes bacterium]|nr:hydrogenase [Candidatus Hydrogenedentota bacterium]